MKKKETKKNKKATKSQKPAAQKQTKPTAKKQQNKSTTSATKKPVNKSAAKKATSSKPAPKKNTSKPAVKKISPKGKSTGKQAAKKKVIKLGSETVTENAVYHLLKDKDKGTYTVWAQPFETWQGKKIRSYKNWHRVTEGSLGNCRRTIQKEVSSPKNCQQNKSNTKKGEGEKLSHPQGEQRKSSVGEIHRGNTKYIDPEPKEQRNYAVVKDNGGTVTVAKVKSIKEFDENGKNADPALVEINHERYGLENRSGVDFETFDQNRMTHKPLQLSDKDVFPEEQPRATMGSHDKHRVLQHVKTKGKKKK